MKAKDRQLLVNSAKLYESFLKTFKKDPKRVDFYYYLADIYFELDKFGKAAVYFDFVGKTKKHKHRPSKEKKNQKKRSRSRSS